MVLEWGWMGMLKPPPLEAGKGKEWFLPSKNATFAFSSFQPISDLYLQNFHIPCFQKRVVWSPLALGGSSLKQWEANPGPPCCNLAVSPGGLACDDGGIEPLLLSGRTSLSMML